MLHDSRAVHVGRERGETKWQQISSHDALEGAGLDCMQHLYSSMQRMLSQGQNSPEFYSSSCPWYPGFLLYANKRKTEGVLLQSGVSACMWVPGVEALHACVYALFPLVIDAVL